VLGTKTAKTTGKMCCSAMPEAASNIRLVQKGPTLSNKLHKCKTL